MVTPDSTLPADKFEKPPEVEPEKPAETPPASKELTAAVDYAVKHLLQGATSWRIPVPIPLDPWQPLSYALVDGSSHEKLQKARDALAIEAIFRIYPGPTSRERLLVVRVMGTTFSRLEVLPWTIGK